MDKDCLHCGPKCTHDTAEHKWYEHGSASERMAYQDGWHHARFDLPDTDKRRTSKEKLAYQAGHSDAKALTG